MVTTNAITRAQATAATAETPKITGNAPSNGCTAAKPNEPAPPHQPAASDRSADRRRCRSSAGGAATDRGCSLIPDAQSAAHGRSRGRRSGVGVQVASRRKAQRGSSRTVVREGNG
jgi:hypothetical protein